MANMINFDVIPELVDNTTTITSVCATGFMDVLIPLANTLKATEQDEPVIEEIIQLTKKVEENYNALMMAYNTHHQDLLSISEIAGVLSKRETGVTVKQGEEVGVKLTARADAIKNL